MSSPLGRGLGSLIPQKVNRVTSASGEVIVTTTSDSDKDRILQLSPNDIVVNRHQPRSHFSETQQQELIDSIRVFGIIQPLIVTKRGDGYELIAGERRLRSAKAIGLKTVPVLVRETKEQEMLELALIENIQRENLNPLEMAISYRKLMDEFNLNQDELAKRVSKSRSSIANGLRLLNLPNEIQTAIIEGRITESHAKLLLGIESEQKQMQLFRKIVTVGLSVSDTAKETKRMGGTKQARVKTNVQDQARENDLRQALGTKVEIKRKTTGGQIVIDFYSDEDLNGLLTKINNS
ncbi:MAG: ParB/RepB/Spo0J family partition protein [Candidatus Falkowbacteria bacterium]